MRFRLRGSTRVDQSPVHIALREALVNLLVHADYAEPHASLVLRSPEGYLLRNPGSSRVPEVDLLKGDRSDPRNPLLVRMFRLIGFAEEAGTGIPKIVQAWRELGLRLPKIDAGTERYEFTIDLRHAHLLSDDDRNWLRFLGREWTEAQQIALVHARHEGEVDNVRLRRLTGIHATDATKVLTTLRGLGLLERVGTVGPRVRYTLSAHAATYFPEGGRPSPSRGGATERLPQTTHVPQARVPSLEDKGQGLEVKSEGLDGKDKYLEENFSELVDVLPSLRVIARPSVENRRLSPNVRSQIIIGLCRVRALSTQQLALLMDRHPREVRNVVRLLVESGYLTPVYKDHPRHPKQKYTATVKSDSPGEIISDPAQGDLGFDTR